MTPDNWSEEINPEITGEKNTDPKCWMKCRKSQSDRENEGG